MVEICSVATGFYGVSGGIERLVAFHKVRFKRECS